MLSLEFLRGRTPGLARGPGKADRNATLSNPVILETYDRVDGVVVRMKSKRLPDLEASGFARQHYVAGLVGQDELLPVDAHRDHLGHAAAIRRQLKPARPEIADDDHRLVASVAQLELLKLSAFAAHHGAIERRFDGDQTLQR